MRIRLLVLTLTLAALTTHAQNNLSGSRQTSAYVYVYRLEPKQALTLFDNDMTGWDKMLRKPVDSFLTGKQDPEDLHLPAADYLFVYAHGSQLHAALHSIGPLRYDLLSSGKDAALTLHTPDGQPINDAIVTVQHHREKFNPVSNSYPLGHSRQARVVTITHGDALYYFSVELNGRYGHRQHRHWWNVPTDFARMVQYHIRNYFNSKTYRSYLVFSKPKYKPRDTVRFKAFIMTSTGRPVQLPLKVRLREKYGKDPDTVITRILPYRAGNYNSYFVLTDSLDLMLDEDYRITLENPRDKPLAEGHFRYEDYSLTSLQLEARVDKPVNSPGDPVSLYVKATDDNDLPVPDARVRIRAGRTSLALGFHRPAVFIPDTIWTHDQQLDPVGETRIILPDSIFPPASFRYQIHVELLNSDNEYREKEFDQEYRDDTGRLFIEPREDSIRIDYRDQGRSGPAAAFIRALDLKGDEITRTSITLPATIRTSPFAGEYEIAVPLGRDTITENWTCGEFHPTVSLSSGRTHDSVAIQVTNPQHLSFWYTIRAGDRPVVQGYGDSLFYQSKTVTPAPYYITLQYRWAGRIQKNEYPIPFRERLLQVEVHQPNFVYPGQKTIIAVDVKDSRGRPVPDADITAWSYTAKFNSAVITGGIPYLGKQYRSPIRYNYSMPKQKRLEDEADLDWRRWSTIMGLDTIEFYKWLNPDSLYINREAVPDLVTQIAAFVSRKGQPEPIHLLYIDERPVFFGRTNEYPTYSFFVTPGPHSLVLRTATSEIRLDTIRIAGDAKTFIGINDDTANHSVRIRRMPDTLTPNEREVLRHSLIALQNTFDYKYVLLSQEGGRNFLFNTGNNYSKPGIFLAGPFSGETAVLREEDGFRQAFDPEGAYRFTISEGLIKEKEWPLSDAFRQPLDRTARIGTKLTDRSMTYAIADSLWEDYLDIRSRTMDFFHNEQLPPEGNGAIEFSLSEPEYPWATPKVFVKKVFLFRYDDPDFMRIYAGSTRSLGYVTPGYCRLFLLLKSRRYLTLDSIIIKPNGLNFFIVPVTNIHAADSFSHRIGALLLQQEDHWTNTNSPELGPMQSTFNERYIPPASFHRRVNGRVLDDDGHPLSGATVLLKGTRFATVTNREGYYQLATTDRGTLVFSAIGFNVQTISLREPYTFDVSLHPSSSELNEVVVIGYGATRKMELTGSVSVVTENSLMGKVAGIQLRGIRGSAAAGAIIITTKATANGQPAPVAQQGNTLRHRFRDDAWWQTTLRTDKDGKVSFPVQFPDDITNWNTFVIATTDHRQIGLAEGNIRSFKGLSAALGVPAFLLEGDSARVIGKVLNYMPDSTTVNRSFSIDSVEVANGDYGLRTAHLDTFLVHPTTADSVRLRYTFQQPNGYADGEERIIPVYRAGAAETIGTFSVLEGDTTIHLSFDTSRGPVHLFASASILPVFLDEIEHLQRYEYGCNEQLASKLRALLEKKRILALLQKPFKEEDMIKDLIKRLMKARNEGLWGWWPEAEPSAWITLHVADALQAAEKEGYPTGLDKGPLIAYLVYRLENKSTEWDRLFILQLLQEMQAKVDYKRYIADAEKNVDHSNWLETLRLMEIRQTAGMDIRLDTLVTKRSITALGSSYWGEDMGGLWDNPTQRTLLMYRMLRQAGGYETLLPGIRNYFLEQRGPGHWRNTYESSLILQTLLPDLLKNGTPLTPPSLHLQRTGSSFTAESRSDSLSGPLAANVKTFPFETRCPATTELNVHKQGALPIYFTAWQQYWNGRPEKVNGTFGIHTGFEGHGHSVTRLTAGEPVELRIDVDVKGDAEYVMVEVPIPAGCTYLGKEQPYGNQEVHREYFKNKLSIFCGFLSKGTHSFRVSLLPRFTGVYRLNPARAELMYFPVLYGREAMQTVTID